MTTHESAPEEADDFDLIDSGWSHHLQARFRYLPAGRSQRFALAMAIVVVAWVPLVLLSLIGGNFSGHQVKMPFIEDIETQIRFLVVLPILVFSEIAVRVGLATQARHLVEMGVIHQQDRHQFRKAQLKIMWFRESIWIELCLVLLSLILAILIRTVFGFSEGTSSWERMSSGAFTLAGWWHTCVGLPLVYFLLLRWIFVIICWNWFLYLVSRLSLKLTPTHPDHVGGLGFLGWGIASFSPVVMGASLVFSAGIATEIIQQRESLDSLKYHCLIFLIIVLILLYVPLLCFAKQLSSCRFKGLLEFGALVWKHDRDFEEKWMSKNGEPPSQSLLGNSDVQSMADIAMCYGHINEMWPIPFDVKAFAVIVLSIVLPMVPLLATAIPLREILLKIFELLA